MPAERMPHSDTSLMSLPLEWLTRLVTRFPVATLVLAAGATAASLALTCTRLGFHTSRADLLSPSCEYNQRWIAYTQEFGDKEDVVVVVEGAGPGAVIPVLDEVSAAIVREGRAFHAVLGQIDLSKARSKGLHYLKPADLQAIEGFLDQLDPVLRGNWAQLSLANMAAWMGAGLQNVPPAQRQQAMAAVQAELGRISESLLAALGEAAQYRSPWPDMSFSPPALGDLGSGYLLADEGRMGFVLLRLTEDDKESFAQNGDALDALKRLVAQARARHPETKIGLTGLPVMENDEMRSSSTSMSVATMLSFFGVLAVLVVAFGGFRHSLMAMGALVLGMIWACGAITLTVGYVNILSIAFGSILFGLGIDYGVYFVARYLQTRETARSTREAIVETAASVGPGITTGAVTSAIAFFATGFTDFKGVAQLGVIAGSGILLCWVAQMTVLPAMIQLADARGLRRSLPIPLNLNFWLTPLFAKPRFVLTATVAATAVLALGMRYLWYDYNLLHLQPVGLESVELEQKLCDDMNRSAYFALSIADTPEELLARKAQFLELPAVERVEEIASLLPPDEELKCPIIARIQRRLANLPQRAPQLPVVAAADLERLLGGAQMMMAGTKEAAPLGNRLAQVCELLRRMPAAEYQRRMVAYQQGMVGELLARLHALRAAANPEPPQLGDLPEGVVTRFVGKHGRFLQKIYSKGSIWDMEAMRQFAQQVRSVDPRVTGNPLQIYEASQQMKQSFEQAAWYALMAIVPFVLFDYRRLSHTLLAMVPMGVGMAQTYGLLGFLDIALNPANMIVLPLLLGIGIENGVNIVHDFRNQGKGYRRISNSTTVAVVVNSLTTMVGFAALMIADHRGVQCLGRVMTIAMGCCLFSSLVLPNLLLLYRQAGQPAREDEEPSADDGDLQLPAAEAQSRRYAA